MKQTLKTIGNTAIWIFLVFAVFISVFVFSSLSNPYGYPEIAGRVFISVISEKNVSPINTGDLLIVNPISSDGINNLKPDDIIIFVLDTKTVRMEDVVIDRITSVAYGESTVTFRFENSETISSTVSDGELNGIGIIALYDGIKIPFLGFILSFLVTQTGFISVVIIPLVLIFLFELFNYIIAILAVRSRKYITAEYEAEIKKKAVEEYLSSGNSEENGESSDKENDPAEIDNSEISPK